jgi:hypothetical protein
MKSYADIEQSKKLAEILPIKSADMFWRYNHNIHTYDDIPKILVVNNWDDDYNKDIPCWSLAALIDALPKSIIYTPNQVLAGYCCKNIIHDLETYGDNPINACYEMILKLHELNLL